MSTTALSEKVEALIQAGMRGKHIAERAGCSSSTISRIRTGYISDPNYSIGAAIDELYSRLAREPASAV